MRGDSYVLCIWYYPCRKLFVSVSRDVDIWLGAKELFHTLVAMIFISGMSLSAGVKGQVATFANNCQAFSGDFWNISRIWRNQKYSDKVTTQSQSDFVSSEYWQVPVSENPSVEWLKLSTCSKFEELGCII